MINKKIKILSFIIILFYFQNGFTEEKKRTIIIPTKFKSSIGFKNYKNINSILNFVLPNWGYKSFYFKLHISGDGDYSDSELQDQAFFFEFNPFFILYGESEYRIYHIRLGRPLDSVSYFDDRGFLYELGKEKKDNEYENYSERTFSKPFTYEEKIYFSNSFFFHTNIRTIVHFSKRIPPKSYETEISEKYSGDLRIGLGFGKIRDITSVIRALRFNERLILLEKNKLSEPEILKLASIFNRDFGYSNVYSRSEKYFHERILTSFPEKLNNISILDYFYLLDIFSENIGQRMQGMEFKGGIQLNHLKYREKYSTSTQYSFFGFYLLNEFYKNLSLRTQLGYNLDYSIKKSIDEHKKIISNQDIVSTIRIKPMFLSQNVKPVVAFLKF